jgi:integrase
MAVILKGKNPNKPHTVRYWVEGHTHSARCKPECNRTETQRERSFATAKEARDFKIKTEHDTRAQIFVDDKLGKVTFGEYAQMWLKTYRCSANTRKTYASVLNTQLSVLAGRTLAGVAKDREGITELLTVALPAAKVGASRIKAVRVVLLAVMDAALAAGRLSRHNLTGIKIESVGRPKKAFVEISRKQAEVIAETMGIVALLMFGCGLRIEEALAVNIGGFRENGLVLRVSEQATSDGKGTGPLKHRKDGEYRDIPVPSWLWAKVQKIEPTQDGYLVKGDSQMFPIYSTSLRRFKIAAKTAGLPATVTPHDMRHSYASTLLAANIQITNLAKWLGHRNINETYNTYGHLVPSAFGEARSALEAAWEG